MIAGQDATFSRILCDIDTLSTGKRAFDILSDTAAGTDLKRALGDIETARALILGVAERYAINIQRESINASSI